MKQIVSIVFRVACLMGPAALADEKVVEVLEYYCFDCHGDGAKKGGLDLSGMLGKEDFDGSLIFENLVTGKMPPADKDQPEAEEKRELLDWLAKQQRDHDQKSFRRLSRHEFVHSVNDLLRTDLDLAGKIPEDRGTNDFDSNRKIQLSREMLGSYFSVADEMLDHAFPDDGFPVERSWVTSKVRDSHES
ncbi:DUF1587 domain-containing protein, partial [bacterium]|nr:DUF1587 domain-containing protein [bacterium]